MATTIKLKNGSGAPLASSLVQGEPAFDLTNKRLYTENASGTVIEIGTNPSSLTIGDWTISLDGSDLRFIYSGTDVFKITTTGNLIAAGTLTESGSP